MLNFSFVVEASLVSPPRPLEPQHLRACACITKLRLSRGVRFDLAVPDLTTDMANTGRRASSDEGTPDAVVAPELDTVRQEQISDYPGQKADVPDI